MGRARPLSRSKINKRCDVAVASGVGSLRDVCLSLSFQMYSEGSEFLPQNNETALQYFKKASDLVRKQPQADVFWF